MRSPPFGACWLTVSEPPSHWGSGGCGVLALEANLREEKAEALENWVGFATRNQRDKDRNWPPQRELGVRPPCFASEETEARSAKVTFRGWKLCMAKWRGKLQFSNFFQSSAHTLHCLRACRGKCGTESRRKEQRQRETKRHGIGKQE